MTDQKSDDDRSSAKPQVIDLTAEEVRPEDSSPAQGASETDAARREETATFSATPEAADADRDRHEEALQEDTRADPLPEAREDATREAEPEISPPPPPPPPPPAAAPVHKKSGKTAWVIAALAVGLLAGGWFYRDVLSNYFPNDEMAAMRVRIDTLESNAQTLGNQMTAAGQSLEAATAAATSATDEARAAQAGLSSLATRIEGLDQRIAAADNALAAAKADLEELRKSISSPAVATGGGGPADTAALAALGQRIDALEKDVASLKSSSGGDNNTSVTSALSQALADLKAKVAAGTGYAAEYDRISRMVPAAPGLDVLASSAEAGLPGAQGLAQELRAAIPALPQPEAPPAEPDGYWESLLDSLSGIITIREIGEANWPLLAEKAAAFAEAGDLTQAISTIDGAEGEKPMALTQWRDRAAARLRLEAALEQVSDAVLRQIAALGGIQ